MNVHYIHEGPPAVFRPEHPFKKYLEEVGPWGLGAPDRLRTADRNRERRRRAEAKHNQGMKRKGGTKR